MSTAYAHLPGEAVELLERSEALARDVFAPLAEQGSPGRINRPLVRALGEHGLLGRVLGGSGDVPALDLCLAREGLARHCTEAETAFAMPPHSHEDLHPNAPDADVFSASRAPARRA